MDGCDDFFFGGLGDDDSVCGIVDNARQTFGHFGRSAGVPSLGVERSEGGMVVRAGEAEGEHRG